MLHQDIFGVHSTYITSSGIYAPTHIYLYVKFESAKSRCMPYICIYQEALNYKVELQRIARRLWLSVGRQLLRRMRAKAPAKKFRIVVFVRSAIEESVYDFTLFYLY